jgi:molecular chaperone GrpE
MSERPSQSESRDGPAADDQEQPSADERVAELERRLQEVHESLLRTLADQENMRRVALRDRDAAVKYAASGFAEDLIRTADNLERAIQSAPGEELSPDAIQRYVAGVLATHRGLLETFQKHGITRIDPLGEAFDPNLHQAVYQEADPNAPEGAVIEVMQPGYLHHDRVLRPAMVGVATGGESGR